MHVRTDVHTDTQTIIRSVKVRDSQRQRKSKRNREMESEQRKKTSDRGSRDSDRDISKVEGVSTCVLSGGRYFGTGSS